MKRTWRFPIDFSLEESSSGELIATVEIENAVVPGKFDTQRCDVVEMGTTVSITNLAHAKYWPAAYHPGDPDPETQSEAVPLADIPALTQLINSLETFKAPVERKATAWTWTGTGYERTLLAMRVEEKTVFSIEIATKEGKDVLRSAFVELHSKATGERVEVTDQTRLRFRDGEDAVVGSAGVLRYLVQNYNWNKPKDSTDDHFKALVQQGDTFYEMFPPYGSRTWGYNTNLNYHGGEVKVFHSMGTAAQLAETPDALKSQGIPVEVL